MSEKTYAEMSGPELVAAFNALAAAKGAKPVKRFSTREAGVRRCEELAAKEVLTIVMADMASAVTQEEGDVTTKKAKPKRATKVRKAKAPSGKLTNRQKLKNALMDPLGKKKTREELCKAVYGTNGAEWFGPLNMSIRGLKLECHNKTFPYKLTRVKNDEGKICYVLNNA